ncbi:hypothetical protein [Actinoplanes sp. DH11]|uniref:hypothetical protein n=1 Tax=Actinoplanes sp. DH11 TaxID=2857011 RepID=UPI001E573D96|nr:hypothetical protein [Actinoplanes sp. DH11]
MTTPHIRLADNPKPERDDARRRWPVLLALFLSIGFSAFAVAPATGAAAASCRTTDRYIDYDFAGKVRAVRVHIKAKWCWDGRTVTGTFAPEVYHTVTNLGSFYVNVEKDPIVESWEDPQHNGHWTRRIVLRGKIDVSVFKYGHIKTLPINMDLRLFGDGVTYLTRY